MMKLRLTKWEKEGGKKGGKGRELNIIYLNKLINRYFFSLYTYNSTIS